MFTRPRRFEKTLNMDMLLVFFEISDEDTVFILKRRAIWKCGQEYTRHQEITAVYKMRFWCIYYRLGQFGKEMVHNKGGKMLNRQVYVSDNEFIICPIADEDRDNYVELHR